MKSIRFFSKIKNANHEELVSHAPDSLRESLVHYSRVVRSGLD